MMTNPQKSSFPEIGGIEIEEIIIIEEGSNTITEIEMEITEMKLQGQESEILKKTLNL